MSRMTQIHVSLNIANNCETVVIKNDTSTSTSNNSQLTLNKRPISWKSDKDETFGSDVFPKNFQNGSLIGSGHLNESIPLNEQEDLIVWMRTDALPMFRKLYGEKRMIR